MRMHSPILRAPRASARSRGGAPVRLIVTAVMLGMWLPATASAADAAAAGRASGPATALESVSLTLSSGRPLTVWLRVPEAAAQAPMPAAVVLGGFETGGGVLDLVPLEHPAILATFDYPYEAPRKLGLLSLFAELDRFRQGVDDTIEAVVRLHDLLAARADVDDAEEEILAELRVSDEVADFKTSWSTSVAETDAPKTPARQPKEKTFAEADEEVEA